MKQTDPTANSYLSFLNNISYVSKPDNNNNNNENITHGSSMNRSLNKSLKSKFKLTSPHSPRFHTRARTLRDL